jgi:cytoskeletal protein RodZ
MFIKKVLFMDLHEVKVFAMIALLGLLIWTVHFYHRRKHKT